MSLNVRNGLDRLDFFRKVREEEGKDVRGLVFIESRFDHLI